MRSAQKVKESSDVPEGTDKDGTNSILERMESDMNAIEGVVLVDREEVPAAKEVSSSKADQGQSRPRQYCLICGGCCAFILLALSIPLAVGMTRGFGSQGHLESSYEEASSNGVGYPVWPDDADQIVFNSSRTGSTKITVAGVEKLWNDGLIFPPLQGWTGKVNPRFKVFLEEMELSPTSVVLPRRTNLATLRQHCLSLFCMRTSGYILVNKLEQPFGLLSSVLVSTREDTMGDKSTSPWLSNKGLGLVDGSYMAVPSRDGSKIASFAWHTDYTRSTSVDYFAYDIDFRVMLLNAATLEATTEKPISFRRTVGVYMFQGLSTSKTRQQPFYYWGGSGNNGTNDGDIDLFYMTDLKGFALVFDTSDSDDSQSASPQEVPIPSCIPLAVTSSGPVRASSNNGKTTYHVLGVDNNADGGGVIQVETLADGILSAPFCSTMDENSRS